MKASLLLTWLITFNSIASCDWKTNIIENDGKFIYSKDCHLEVGQLVKDNDLRKNQIVELKKTLELKDLALDISDKRVIQWRDETYKQNDYLNKQYTMSINSNWMYFGLGMIMTGLSVYGARKLRPR